MPHKTALLVLTLTSACVTHTESTQVITSQGDISASTQVYDPKLGRYVTRPAGSSTVTRYEERTTTPSVVVIVRPDCASRHRPPDRGGLPKRVTFDNQVKSRGVTINCR